MIETYFYDRHRLKAISKFFLPLKKFMSLITFKQLIYFYTRGSKYTHMHSPVFCLYQRESDSARVSARF
jgi:hypothetical protein